MKTAHQVFVSDKPLIFASVYERDHPAFSGYDIVSENTLSVTEVAGKLEKKSSGGIVYLSEDPDQSWKRFLALWTLVEAAGGIVRNPERSIGSIS